MWGFRYTSSVITLVSVLAGGASVLATASPAQAAPRRDPAPVAASVSTDRTLQDATLRRPSGLAVDTTTAGTVYTVDGSRRSLQLLAVGATGRTQSRWSLSGAKAVNVTDIALGLGRQVWIGDLGDAARTRREVAVFSTRRPTSAASRAVAWSSYRLRYADGRHDAQALLVNPTSGRLYVVTHDSVRGAVYQAPAHLTATGVNVLRKVATAPADVTGGEFSRSGTELALTHGNQVSILRTFGALATSHLVVPGSAPGYVAFDRSSTKVLVGARTQGSTLLRVALSAAATATPAPATPAPATPGTSTPGTSTPVTPAVDPLIGIPAVTSGLLGTLNWRNVQEPRLGAITLLDQSALPASPTKLHPGKAMRVELRDKETVTTSGYTAHRAEVYGRSPTTTWSSTPSSQWADPPGSTRYYDFSVYVPADFPLATDGNQWFDFTQWKGYRGGSPPVALEMKRNEFRLGGSRTSQSLGTVTRGAWTRFTVGIHFSTSAKDGWVEVYRDGQAALPRRSMSTLDTVNGQADPVYLKQGIYRSYLWQVTQVLYYSPMQVTTTNPLLG